MVGFKIPFYNNWTFLRTDLNATMGELERQKTRFAPVEIPHDWLIYDAKNLYQDGCGWYRKEFSVVTGEIEDMGADFDDYIAWLQSSVESGDEKIVARINRGEHVLLRFEGVYMDTTVYVNGKKIGDWKYGYSTFDMDITHALVQGKNQITVQVRHHSPNSRWYSGAGMFRKVWLKVCPAVSFQMDGTYVHTTKQGENFELTAESEIIGKMDSDVGCRYELWKDGEMVQDLGWHAATPVSEDITEANAAKWQKYLPVGKVCLKAVIEKPAIWDVEDPQLYHLKAKLCRRGREKAVIDLHDITIGFRHIEFTTDKGFFLNGRWLKIHGVCEHHDLGCLGAAFHKPAMKRKIEILKTMGVNAIRTSHNMPAPELMDLADEMGILIVSEAFDMWERSKTEYDYGRFFKQWVERDVRSWVRRDRNHPSLLMWSIGNEIYDTHADDHGQEITRRLVAAVQAHDPKKNAPITIGSNYMPWENAQKCADIVKMAGYNYGETCYEAHHAAHPDWVMYGSETASVVQSRGIYHFPLKQSILCEEDEQCSSLGNSCTSWGAKSWEKCITDDRDPEYILGQFIWTGFDYIGEPTPYHTKNSYFGQIDTAGFPKDSYYAFRAEWTDVKKAPFVHLFPYWDFNPGQLIDVRTCTNAPEVELFVNGVSQGRKSIDHVHGLELIPSWQVVYVPGKITAVAYDEKGMEIARDEHVSFGDSKKIVLQADRTSMQADCEDMCFVTVSMVDENGNPVENASDYVKAEIQGPGRILGMDNGDSTDYDNYKGTVRKLFVGKLLIVLGNTGETGDVTLKVTGKNLEAAELVIPVTAAATQPIIQHHLDDCCKGRKMELPGRIPARKIELRCDGAQQLTPDKTETVLEAVLLPANTTDTELVWKAVTAGGIEVNFVKLQPIEEEGKKKVLVKAIGDGEFYVRCSAVIKDRAVVMSQLEFVASGLGKACINPYEYVSAGLYTGSYGGEIGNGNEKGIATDRGKESGVSFSNIDFGEYGSDELTIDIFALNSEEYPLDIWLGEPHAEGSRLLTKVIYQKPSIWNVYQAETYKLPERIKGIATISFVMYDKVHIKGFCFKAQEKAFGKLYANEANAIYGDTFTRDGQIVRGIGNNVTIAFENMDFGEMGTTKVAICGRTPLAVNTIHISFTDEKGKNTRCIIEFAGTGSELCEIQNFALEKLTGKGKVELVFLPGCDFDLESIQFS